ncbi:MAG: hypothetical protein M1835_006477 [Candelina submexicana]|nr:MAG: hypothetical protein M1835_006477 [Candelina submexicana]
MRLLYQPQAQNFTFLISLLIFTTSSWATTTTTFPPGETLHDATVDGRSPNCDGEHFGSPTLRHCNAAIRSFITIILRRGFDLHQSIEFLDTGQVSLFAEKYPRQPLTQQGDLHTFAGRMDYNSRSREPANSVNTYHFSTETCVLRFFMLEPLDNNDLPQPTAASFISTYNDFLGAARVLAGTCVQTEGRGGWMQVRGQGRAVAVTLGESMKDEPEDASRLAETRNYRPNLIDTSLIPYQLPVREESAPSPPAFGDLGQGSSTDQGTGYELMYWPTYCDVQQFPSTCEGGGSCSPELGPQNEGEVEEEERRRRVMWGEILANMLGTCAGGSMV